MSHPQPWIFSARFDGAFILAPAILIALMVLLLHGQFDAVGEVPPVAWLLLIVGVDVGHVYSTIFRTYLDVNELRARQTLYVLAPLAAWVVGCFLYNISALVFWRVLAYLAVFHFIRQQYGFMMIYARGERAAPRFARALDQLAIYLATLYPLIYWHCHTRAFEWFVADDFIMLDAPRLSIAAGVAYGAVMGAYVLKEVWFALRTRSFNLPKNLLMLGTALSWFIGIVAFNNDLAFTATNVLAHGIPYLALIWLYGYNQAAVEGSTRHYLFAWVGALFRWRMVPLYLAILFALAYAEEWVWDGLVWREHGQLFAFAHALPAVDDPHTLMWLVPLLALPQATHYILDAFIWRMRTEGTHWKQILFHHKAGTP